MKRDTMMHYIDIRLLPDPEFEEDVLLEALFSSLHRRLSEIHGVNLGISFPKFSNVSAKLGSVLRLHGSEEHLNVLLSSAWKRSVSEFATLSLVLPVPSDAQHRVVRRVQAASSLERRARRYAKRHDVSLEEAERHLSNVGASEERLRLPVVYIRSASTGQRFPIFIEHGKVQAEPATGEFSAYGLSGVATVPWF